MPYKAPTHQVTHIPSGRIAFIYIAPSLQQKLENPHPGVHINAQSSVAISFREAFRKRHGFVPSEYIEYADLHIEVIARGDEYDAEPIRITHGGEPVVDGEYDD